MDNELWTCELTLQVHEELPPNAQADLQNAALNVLIRHGIDFDNIFIDQWET